MKKGVRRNQSVSMVTLFGMMIIGVTYGTAASAGCGEFDLQKASASTWRQDSSRGESARFSPASFMRVSAYDEEADSIVGLWKFKMLSKGNKGIPDGAEIDFGYAAWHSDGTELMNSGSRAPMTSNFCMGVWEKTGSSSFKLNHIGLSWDGTGTVFVGPASIKEQVTVDGSGKHYSGVFSITQYSTDEKTVLAHIVGIVTADRVTAD